MAIWVKIKSSNIILIIIIKKVRHKLESKKDLNIEYWFLYNLILFQKIMNSSCIQSL